MCVGGGGGGDLWIVPEADSHTDDDPYIPVILMVTVCERQSLRKNIFNCRTIVLTLPGPSQAGPGPGH